MEKLDILISKYTPKLLSEFLDIFNLSSKDLLFFTTNILLIFIVKFTIYIFKNPLKYYLYMHRRDSYYRYLFYRVDKVLRPLIYLVYSYFLSNAISNIYYFKDGDLLDILIFFIKLVLLLWFIYEIIKYLIYATIRNKIKKEKLARRELFNLVLNITKVIFVLIAIVAMLSKLGVDVTALITSLGIGGVIIGLSAKDTLINFFDSIRLISEDAFSQGDWIETRDIEGFVTELGLTSTQIRTFDNAMVTIPNSRLANDYIKNWTKRVIGRRIKFHVPIKFTSNTDEIDRVIFEIYNMLHSHPDIVNLNKIKYFKKMKLTFDDGLFNIEDKYGVRRTLLVYLDEIDRYSFNILIYAFSISVNWEDWLKAKQDVLKKIIDILEKSELELAYPTEEIKLISSN